MPEKPDRHKTPNFTVRVGAEDRQAAQQKLDDAGWTFNDFAVACLLMLVKRPKTFLKQLEPFKPASRRGRPAKRP